MKADKHIIIKNCSKEELITVLNDWLMMYVDESWNNMKFAIAEHKPGSFVLKVDKNIDDVLFFYLVNYCAYPIGFDKAFEVSGHATGTDVEEFQNKKMRVFIYENDKEGDNVWVTTEDNKTYKYDFGGRIKKMDFCKKYEEMDINAHVIAFEKIPVNTSDLLEKKRKKEEEERKRTAGKWEKWFGMKNRFKVISIIWFFLILLAFLTVQQLLIFSNEDTVVVLPLFLALMWFILDYKIFSDAKRTLICLALSLLYVAAGINAKNNFMAGVVTLPLSLAAIMWAGNKFLGGKFDYLYDKLERLFVLMLVALAALISAFVFYPIIQLLR